MRSESDRYAAFSSQASPLVFFSLRAASVLVSPNLISSVRSRVKDPFPDLPQILEGEFFRNRSVMRTP